MKLNWVSVLFVKLFYYMSQSICKEQKTIRLDRSICGGTYKTAITYTTIKLFNFNTQFVRSLVLLIMHDKNYNY